VHCRDTPCLVLVRALTIALLLKLWVGVFLRNASRTAWRSVLLSHTPSGARRHAVSVGRRSRSPGWSTLPDVMCAARAR